MGSIFSPFRSPRIAMPGSHPVLTVLALVSFASGCAIEDRSPEGSRRDEEAIRTVVADYYSAISTRSWDATRIHFWDSALVQVRTAPGSAWRGFQGPDAYGAWLASRPGADVEIRPLRVDARQEGDVAAAWVETRRGTGDARSRTPADHFALRRIDGAWRITALATVMTEGN
jgi:hypothetical protein